MMSKKIFFTLSLVVILSLFSSLYVFASNSEGWVTVDVTSNEVNYYGRGLTDWRRLRSSEAFNGVEISSDRDLHEVEFTFEGTCIRWLGSVGPMRGTANVYINNELVAANVDLYKESIAYQQVIFEETLDLGVYTIKIVPTGERSEYSSFNAITVDAFQYLPSLYNKIGEAYALLRKAPTNAEVEHKLVSFNYSDEALESLVMAVADALVAHEQFEPGTDGQIAALISLDKAMNDYENNKIIVDRPSLYSFEGNLEDTLGVFTATADGEVTYEDGMVGQAVNLHGDVYLQLPENHPITTSEQLTVAAWVNWREGNQWQRILDFGNNTSQYFFLTPNSGSNTLRFAITSGSGEQFIETDALPKNEWVHVAVTLGEGEAKLYINGELKASGSVTIKPCDFVPAHNYIGKSQWPDPLFNGLIDEFYINNVALTAEEIQDLM